MGPIYQIEESKQNWKNYSEKKMDYYKHDYRSIYVSEVEFRINLRFSKICGKKKEILSICLKVLI